MSETRSQSCQKSEHKKCGGLWKNKNGGKYEWNHELSDQRSQRSRCLPAAVPLSSVSASWIIQSLMCSEKTFTFHNNSFHNQVAKIVLAVLVFPAVILSGISWSLYLFRDLMTPTTGSSRRSTPVLLVCSKPRGGADRTCFLDLGRAERFSCRVGSSTYRVEKEQDVSR